MNRIALFFIFLFIGCGKLVAQPLYFTSFDGNKLAFTDEGKGRPVLLIHGFINTRKSWGNTELKKDLLELGYRVIVPDLRGNGDSDKPQNDSAYYDNAEVKDLIVLMSHLKIKKYQAVGYSRGSIILAKLMTLDTRIKRGVMGGMGIHFTNPDWYRRIIFAEAFAGNTSQQTQGAVAYAKSINADLRSLHLQQAYQPVTTIKELGNIKIRILVVAGDQDTDNGVPSELQIALQKGTLQIVKGDHNDTYKSKAFAEAITAFLK